MVTAEWKLVDELEKACGNRYLALQLLSQAVRKLEKQYADCRIPESKFITWVLTGECPYSKEYLSYREYINSKASDIDTVLSQVTNETIKKEVTFYYKESVHNKHLTLCTDSSLNQGQVDKINILLRMIWYNFTT